MTGEVINRREVIIITSFFTHEMRFNKRAKHTKITKNPQNAALTVRLSDIDDFIFSELEENYNAEYNTDSDGI